MYEEFIGKRIHKYKAPSLFKNEWFLLINIANNEGIVALITTKVDEIDKYVEDHRESIGEFWVDKGETLHEMSAELRLLRRAGYNGN